MGNQVQNAERKNSTYTPKKDSKNIFSSFFSNEKGRPKSNTKEGLFAEDKLFENFDNTSIFGYRLDTDPEEREYYVNCYFCNKLNLDNGLDNIIECKNCKKEFDAEEFSSKSLEKNKPQGITKSPNRIRKPKKIQELTSLVLSINKDNLFENFYDVENNIINYEIIMKKILLPYFKMKSRIIKKGMFFKIGEIDFKVTGLYPFKKGVITSKTYLHCTNCYSLTTPIQRVLMITTTKYANFEQESLVKKILSSDKVLLINKNEVVNIKQYEFYIRNCEPDSGVLTNETKFSIENRDIMSIAKVKLAIIKNNVPQFQTANERRTYEDYILKEYFKPYFLSGVKKYIERGDVFVIEDLEMFVLNSFPENGFISNETNVMFKIGLNKEKCLEKIHNADNKFALNLLNIEENINNGTDRLIRQTSDISHTRFSHGRIRSFDEVILRNLLNNNTLNINGDQNIIIGEGLMAQREHLIRNLPTITVDEKYLKNSELKSEQEVMKKCVICMEIFELHEILKTLPCFHIFHSYCIDEWLNTNNQCPVCKSDITI